MSSRRRNSKKNLGTNLSDIQRRLRRMERKPIRTRLQNRVIKASAIAPSSITADEVEFGTNIVTDTAGAENPKDLIVNPKAGDEVTDRETGKKQVYDPLTDSFIDVKDPAAQASADGKNTIYRQDYEPTGGTYALGDTWFDTDNSNKIHRYSTAATATVTNKVLTGNFATLTVSSAHTFVVGETITVSGVDATFNGSYEVTATPTALTVRYEKTASNVPSAASSGTITNTAGWKGFALGDGALININANKINAGTLAAGVILASNIDAGQINAGTINASISMTSATIIGGTIQQGSSGNYILMDQTNKATIKFYVTGFTNPGYISVESSYSGTLGEMIVGAPAQGTESSAAHISFYNDGAKGYTYISTDNLDIESQSLLSIGNPEGGVQLKYDITKTPTGVTGAPSSGPFITSVRNISQSLNSYTPSGSDGFEGDVWLTY